MTLVIDASTVIAALIDVGPDGTWAEPLIEFEVLVAPHLMPVEAANILRRSVLADLISADAAALAHQDLIELPVELFPYEPFGQRCWELRGNVTSYDAWHVALAEHLDADLATLDLRLARSPGPACRFLTPPPPRQG